MFTKENSCPHAKCGMISWNLRWLRESRYFSRQFCESMRNSFIHTVPYPDSEGSLVTLKSSYLILWRNFEIRATLKTFSLRGLSAGGIYNEIENGVKFSGKSAWAAFRSKRIKQTFNKRLQKKAHLTYTLVDGSSDCVFLFTNKVEREFL